MSTVPTPEPVVPVAVPPKPPAEREIRIYSHSQLFYWWPVWAVGFLLAVMTYLNGTVMAVVPDGTVPARDANVTYKSGDTTVNQTGRDVLILPEKAHLYPNKPAQPGAQLSPPTAPHLHMAQSKNFGVLFGTVLLLVIVVSNVPLRGLWSLLIILFVVLIIVILALADWWATILDRLSYLDVRINMGGYLFIALVLFIIWAITVFVFDRRTYVIVTPGQVRVCQAVGAGETVYDTTGMTFTKHQNDLFRHWLIGLGSGDLIIHRTNTNQEIDMPNVLFIGAKVREIEQLVKERMVV